jgi:hypothetical protein
MVEDPVPGHKAFWAKKRESLQSEYPAFIEKFPNTDTQYRKLLKVLCTIEDVAGCKPTAVGESGVSNGRQLSAPRKKTGLAIARPYQEKYS